MCDCVAFNEFDNSSLPTERTHSWPCQLQPSIVCFAMPLEPLDTSIVCFATPLEPLDTNMVCCAIFLHDVFGMSPYVAIARWPIFQPHNVCFVVPLDGDCDLACLVDLLA